MYARSYRTEANPRYQAAVAEQRRREQARLEEKKRLKQVAAAKKSAEIIAKYREIVVGEPVRLSVRDIIALAVDGTKYTYDDIVGHRRMRAMTNLRHYAIVYAWALRPEMSLPGLGRQIGNRDHTTILHSVKRFGFQSREEAAAFISLHGREATIARLSKQAS